MGFDQEMSQVPAQGKKLIDQFDAARKVQV
jgi:hypothetical protein